MLLLPVGHDRSEVRRFPFAAAGLVLGCTVAFAISCYLYENAKSAIIKATKAAELFLEENPYLEPSAAESGSLSFACRERVEKLDRGEVSDDGSRDPEAQRHLDGLCRKVAEAWDTHPYFRWGLVMPHPRLESWITHTFQHGGWEHLAGNMLLLFLAGFCLEEIWGRALFLGLYFTGAIVAAGLHVLAEPGGLGPLIGASGAVSALMGAFLVRFWDARIIFFYFFWLTLHGTFRARAWVVLPLWFLLELHSALAPMFDPELMAGGGGHVAHWAHIGGFFYGVLVALAIQASGLEKWLKPAIDRKTVVSHNRALADAMAAEQAGDLPRAFDLLNAEIQARIAKNAQGSPGYPDLVVAFWSVACKLERAAEAAGPLAGEVQRRMAEGEMDGALADLADLIKFAPATRLPPAMLSELLRQVLVARRPDDARYVLEVALGRPQAQCPGGLALALVRQAVAADPKLGLRAIALALAETGRPESTRQQLEQLREQTQASLSSSTAGTQSWGNALDLDSD